MYTFVNVFFYSPSTKNYDYNSMIANKTKIVAGIINYRCNILVHKYLNFPSEP
jgi:hypothetical protein